MRLIVGLGNPDPEYHWTPHNLGFMAVDELANPAAIREFIHGHETQVMRRPVILRIGIPKSDNEPHKRFSSFFSRSDALLFLLALVALLRLGFDFRLGAFFAFHFLLAL